MTTSPLGPAIRDRQSATYRIYRWYDEADTLLYIGITGNLVRRTSAHLQGGWAWTIFAARMDVDRSAEFLTQEAAEAEEARCIIDERPVFNVAGADPEARARAETYLRERGIERAPVRGRRVRLAEPGPRPTPEADTLAAELRDGIRAGAWLPGERFFGWRDLVIARETSLYAAKRALGILRDEGMIVTRIGSGTRVADPLPAEDALSLEERVAALEAWRREVEGG